MCLILLHRHFRLSHFFEDKILYNWSYQFYRYHLSSSQQQAYDIIYRSWFLQKTYVRIPLYLIDDNSFSDVISAIIQDHPEIFWINYFCYKIRMSADFVEMVFSNFFSPNEINRLLDEANAWKKRIIANIPPNLLQKNKAWLLFDYLARQVSYGEQSEALSHTIIGSMSKHNHISVCEGIAKSFKFLCDQAGVPCIIVFGEVFFDRDHEGPHAWNIIETESGLSHIDVTAELKMAHSAGKATQTNFLHSDGDMIQYKWNQKLTPVCK